MPDDHAGERIRAERLRIGWPRKRLAGVSGVPVRRLAAAERGRGRLSPAELRAIAPWLGLSVERLAGAPLDTGFGPRREGAVWKVVEDLLRSVEAVTHFPSGARVRPGAPPRAGR